ncbi:hypothetical protein PF002_g26208 [Phytophthora fragariae]|uniref:Secreted protein n=1 Tax=Phytophthora fragariae TaxID=53985 RepID=A0A6A3IGH8_9STRA|nr:hypothetical protein PF003_g36999 [Phytophthora fragariae]KAE8979578.1 hypothetical protein PF011_g22788 [Phytophthora fragariae]KAE9074689.1 hypothetical protein PF007_g25310 [Phytophthora fragariae]KAE9185295.1 hypothetical protein PF002_g26208 [Phytophthora fragariae]KAE9187052.1 hypothetical protein PF004_g22913 [Phytophthora fragariae]
MPGVVCLAVFFLVPFFVLAPPPPYPCVLPVECAFRGAHSGVPRGRAGALSRKACAAGPWVSAPPSSLSAVVFKNEALVAVSHSVGGCGYLFLSCNNRLLW